MIIEINNIGVIKSSKFDLSKKLNIFCGPNGTGKTYAASIIGYYNDVLLRNDNFIDIDELLDKKKVSITIDNQVLIRARKAYSSFIQSNVDVIFGLNIFNKKFKDFSFKLSTPVSEFMESFNKNQFQFIHTYDNFPFQFDKKSDSNTIDITIKGKNIPIIEPSSADRMGTYLSSVLAKYICHSSILNVFTLPVERNSAFTFISELTLNSIDGSINEKRTPYPYMVKDALRFASAENLKKIRYEDSVYKDLADEIENEILHGKISISDIGEIFFTPKNGNEKLSMHLAASMIKSISGLLLYLRHKAKINDLLIIDEPEIGLHPNNQIILARIIAKLIRQNLRIVVCTHSDYIIKELNNLIMLSNRSNIEVNEIRSKYQYNDLMYLEKEEVGAYLFNVKEDGLCVVKSLDISDYGFDIETIDNAICNLNEITSELYYALEEPDNEN